jgi:predicted nucleic acid-binding protein
VNSILLDTSVVLDVLTRDHSFFEPSLRTIARWGATSHLCINQVVYAEVSVGFTEIESLDEAVQGMGLDMRPIPREALFLAGKAFSAYRRRGGTKTTPLPDFFIGAHAAVERLPLLTRDPSRISNAYPTITIVEPQG